jgi:hypothetical protein
MTGEAVNRRTVLVMAVDAEPHGQIDIALSDPLLADVAVAGGTLDLRPNMWRMIEPDVRFRDETVHPLPRKVETLLTEGRQLLNPGPVSSYDRVTDHAGRHAGNAGHRPGRHTLVTEIARDLLADMNVVWKIERLLGNRTPTEEVIHGRRYRGTRCCEHLCRLAGKHRKRCVRLCASRHEHATADTPGKHHEAHHYNGNET